MKKLALFAFLMACGGSTGGDIDEPLPEPPPCNPAPQGFLAWRSGDLVMVSKKLSGVQSGVALQAEVHNLPGDELPATVDFGAEQIEVREDLELCLL